MACPAAAGSAGLTGQASTPVRHFWNCGGATPTTGTLGTNPTTSPTAFLLSLDPILVGTICGFVPITTSCPAQGLSFNWSDPSGTGHTVTINNQYSLGFAVGFPAGGKFNYSCPSGSIDGSYEATTSQTLSQVFGRGAAPANRGVPGNSGIMFFNGSGAVQSLFVTVNAQTGSGGPMSGFQLTWIDGSGIARGATFDNVLSAGVALTLANSASIRYSCPASTPVAGQWNIEPGP